MRIGYRTIKTAIGVPIAIYLAQFLGITNVASAAILTILSIQPSKRKSVVSAWHRFAACMIAILFSTLSFYFIGFYPLVIGFILLLFIPITVGLNITQGIVTSAVIILNLFSAGKLSSTIIIDQVLIICIGVGTAFLLNIYMPNLERKIIHQQRLLEEKIQVVLAEIAHYIRDQKREWDGQEITDIEEILFEAKRLVAIDKENHLFRIEHTYEDYFVMREKQFDLLRNMIRLVSRITYFEEFSDKTACFFEDLSKSVHPGNTAIIFLGELNELQEIIRQKALPQTREEFETRANLFRLTSDIEDYLIIKSQFKESDVKFESKNKKKED